MGQARGRYEHHWRRAGESFCPGPDVRGLRDQLHHRPLVVYARCVHDTAAAIVPGARMPLLPAAITPGARMLLLLFCQVHACYMLLLLLQLLPCQVSCMLLL